MKIFSKPMNKLRLRWTGISPLLMSSSELINPLSPKTKAIKKFTSKKGKTDDDHEQIALLEWEFLMYYDAKIGPYMPTSNIKSALMQGGAPRKMGPKLALTVIEAPNMKAPLMYEGPRDLNKLRANIDEWSLTVAVVVQRARVMKCRPMFRDWAIEFDVIYDESQVQEDDIITASQTAGNIVGIGAWRPKCKGEYGRFKSEVIK
jgi:hypothetical protein